MQGRIRIKAVPRQEPDTDLLVRTIIAIARELDEGRMKPLPPKKRGGVK